MQLNQDQQKSLFLYGRYAQFAKKRDFAKNEEARKLAARQGDQARNQWQEHNETAGIDWDAIKHHANN